jgi:hypothetical protein
MKSRRMGWDGRNMSKKGEKGNECMLLVRKPEGKSHYEDQDVDGRIILRWIL